MSVEVGGLELMRRRVAGLFAQAETLTGAAWCEKYLTLYDPQHQLDGRVDFSRYPFLREVVDSMCDPQFREVVLMCSAQMLKTTAIIMAAAYHVARRDVPLIWAMDSQPNARKFSQTRWQPFIEVNDVLRSLKPANADMFKTLEQHFSTLPVFFLGAHSPGAAASMPGGLLVMDEKDKFGDFSGREASAADLLTQRLAGSYNGRSISASTPTFYDAPINQDFLRLDQRLLFVPCPNCREYFTMVAFGGLKWDQGARRADGTWDLARVMESAHYECPHCGGAVWDHQKPAMVRAGEWCATNKSPMGDGRSYRINRLYSVLPSGSFGNLARLHLLAGNDPSKRQDFSNSVLAEPYEDSSDKHDVAEVLEHLEKYPDGGRIPRGALLLTVGVDVQRGRDNDPNKPPRLEAECVAWGLDEETWGVEKVVFRCGAGSGSIDDLGPNGPWAKLDRWLLQPRVTEDGRVLPVACAMIDSGWKPETVYAFCEPRLARNVFPCKGKSPGRPGDPMVSLGERSNVRRVPVHLVSRWTGNMFVFGKLGVKVRGPHFMHFPNDPAMGYSKEFFEQLVSERLSKRRVGGQIVAKWVDDGRATEGLACRRYACAAYARLNADMESFARQAEIRFEEMEAARVEKPEKVQETKKVPEKAAVNVDEEGYQEEQLGRDWMRW